jgi:hypothetical protein
MNSEAQIEIPLNKTRLVLTFFGSLVYIVCGLWVIILNSKYTLLSGAINVIMLVLGSIAILFFVAIAITVLHKLFDKKPGLTINQQGILDNSSGISVGLIPWAEIKEVKIARVISQKFMMLITTDPKKYIDKEPNPLKKFFMKMNHKMFGSPISISANMLSTNFNALEKLVREKMQAHSS